LLGLPYTLTEIAQAAWALDLFQGEYAPEPLHYVAFDSRAISHGPQTLFVALKTANRDGHDFIPDALAKGVRNFLTDRDLPYPEVNYAQCADTLEALQTWARYHRLRFSYPVLALTGSNGKTIIKEWLATLLEREFQLVKSPMSYNSQLGVALSLLQMHPQADLAIIEAGISQAGEMEVLAEMIQPTLGLLTHMGSAHAEGFASEKEKLAEKLQLFASVDRLLASSRQQAVQPALQALGRPLVRIGTQAADDWQLLDPQREESGWKVELKSREGKSFAAHIPLNSEADLENASLAFLAAVELGLAPETAAERLSLLYPVQMRTEIITDNPEVTLINDSYNSDVDAVRNALQLLADTSAQPHRSVILSDIPHLGERQEATQRQILAEAEALAGPERVYTVGPVFARLRPARAYPDTEALLQALRYEDFVQSTVLLKGARSFALERVIPLLSRRLNATYFRLDLDALVHNYRYLKARLPAETRTMCMVKAYGYGSGSWEIARVLEREGATYLAVAYASEGIELRQARIGLPIMVMNPDWSSLEALLRYDLEPQVSNLAFLEKFLRVARLSERRSHRIHLKLETGMGRLGFREADLPALIERLAQQPDVEVVSTLSHLSAADDPAEDAFSQQQAERFLRMVQQLQQALGIVPFRHLLNTAGLLRLPAFSFDMVRLGLGLYGINPVPELSEVSGALQEMGSLHSTLTQVQTYPAGTSIGYGRSQYTKRTTRIATVPVGYADGIPRALSNGKASFLVRGQPAPIFGRVCMDMLMLDVTDIPEVQAGDEVVLFGQQGEAFLPVTELAKAAGTIPYEILVRISPRVRRVYVQE
jgi:Alr-MurF fusion protein